MTGGGPDADWRARLGAMAGTSDPVAIFGLGSIGRRYGRILAEAGFAVIGHDVSDAAARRAAEEAGVTPVADPAEPFRRRLSLCIVATPPDAHRAPAEMAISHGTPTLVEKPLAHAMADAEALCRSARDSGTPCFCVCNMRFHPGVEALGAHRGRIGSLAGVRARFGHRLSQMRPAGVDVFAARKGMGGGVVLDCIHEIDYLQALLGPLSFVSSRLAHLGLDPHQVEDWARIDLRTREGRPVGLDLDFVARRKKRGCELVGSEGTLVWSSDGRAPEEVSVVFETDKSREVLMARTGLPADDEYGRMLAAVLAALRGPSPPQDPSLQSLDEARRSLALCLRALEAGVAP